MEALAPIKANERITSIDIIRGFSILGIFLVNILSFSSPWIYLEKGIMWKSALDIGTETFIDIFAQASFYTLFSFLFGFGMVIILERAEAKNYNFPSLFTRRLFVLFVIGVIHAFFIWHGDILISYAFVGLFLLLFYQSKPITLLIWSFLLILIPSFIWGSYLYGMDKRTPYPLSHYNPLGVHNAIEVYSTGNFIEITQQRITDWLYANGGLGFLFLIFLLLPMFLLGAYVAKKKWFHEPENHMKAIRWTWGISLIFGLIFKIIIPYSFERNAGLFYIQDSIGGPATAIFYATSIVLLVRISWMKKILTFFSYIGRLSLSNYLFQSIVSTFIFYGYGFGFYGKVSPFYGVLLVIFIYIVQVILSKWYLTKFSIGPIEWIWRNFTYMAKQPIRKTENKVRM